MGKFVSLLVAGLLLLLVLAIPLFLLGWWGHDAWQRRQVAHSPTHQGIVLRKSRAWGGRAFGLQYVAEVALNDLGPAGRREMSVPVSESEYEALQPGQLVAVRYNASTTPQALLASSRWWTWTHVWWLATGLFLLGYFLKRLASMLRPVVPDAAP